MDLAKEALRDQRRLPSLGSWLQDVRFAGLISTLALGLRELYTTVQFPPSAYYVTLQFWPRPLRMLFRVEMPLALPTVMAGLRVATVSTVPSGAFGFAGVVPLREITYAVT